MTLIAAIFPKPLELFCGSTALNAAKQQWELFMTSGGFLCINGISVTLPTSPPHPNLQILRPSSTLVRNTPNFSHGIIWEGRLFPFGLGGTANINIWAHPLPPNVCIFVFFAINFAFLPAYGLSLALQHFEPVQGFLLESLNFFFAAGKGGTWIQLWFFCLLGCFLHLISLLSTRFLSIRGVLSCSCKSGGWENICWTWNEWPPVPPEICFLLGHLHLPLYLCAVCV